MVGSVWYRAPRLPWNCLSMPVCASACPHLLRPVSVAVAAASVLVSAACLARPLVELEAAVGAVSDASAGRSSGWRLSAAAMVPLGDAGVRGGLVLGYAAVGATAQGPFVQRHRRTSAGPFLALQAAVPIADGWQARARFGLANWQTALVTTVHGAEAFDASERHVGPLISAGLAWQWTPALALTASVDVGHHRFEGLPTVRPALWSLGLSASF